ncbi:MAG: aminotransferase class I/II-fold pyridoxal phosphate-dependent enzyme [Candidatus Gracilibacteria bacterium]
MANTKVQHFNNSLVTPINQSATYFFRNTQEVIEYHEGSKQYGRYGRYDNQNWIECEEKLARLDNFSDALIFPSGMSAITTTLLALLTKGDHVIVNGKTYRNVRNFCTSSLPKYGIEVSTFELNETYLENILAVYNENTKVIFVEMPSNPHLYVADISKIRNAIRNDTILIVDSTLITPINYKPKDFGANLVIHSCGKYIGGHSDILVGSVSGEGPYIEIIRNLRNIFGCIVDAHAAFLLARSLETLEIRIQHQNTSGQALAEFLAKHPKIKTVFYPGLPAHPNYHLAASIFSGFGGVMSFEIDGNMEDGKKFIDNLKIPYMGTNFGGTISMVEQCSVFTYYKLAKEERDILGISDTLIRFSVGMENIADIIADIHQALNLTFTNTK